MIQYNVEIRSFSQRQPEGLNKDETNETAEIVNVTIGTKYTVKINKVSHNKPACTDIYDSDITKMTALNLTVVMLRKQQRITRERKVLTEALFCQLHNEDAEGNNRAVSTVIKRLKDKDDYCLFDRFTSEVRGLM